VADRARAADIVKGESMCKRCGRKGGAHESTCNAVEAWPFVPPSKLTPQQRAHVRRLVDGAQEYPDA